MKARIREAQQSDVYRLAELMRQLGYSISPGELTAKITDFANNQSDAFFVAELNDQVVGVISCHITPLFHQPGCSGRITSLVVEQSVRGHGLGKQLVETAEAYFNHHHCVKFEVTSGLNRTDTHPFYQSLGYQADNLRFSKTAPDQ